MIFFLFSVLWYWYLCLLLLCVTYYYFNACTCHFIYYTYSSQCIHFNDLEIYFYYIHTCYQIIIISYPKILIDKLNNFVLKYILICDTREVILPYVIFTFVASFFIYYNHQLFYVLKIKYFYYCFISKYFWWLLDVNRVILECVFFSFSQRLHHYSLFQGVNTTD